MPRYAFCCRTCGLEFEVSRAMSDAGREASCPVDGGEADRLFTAPMTSIRQGDGAAVPPGGSVSRSWSSPFFPKAVPGGDAPRATVQPRHILPAGSSKPTRFRHFGHWHPAGTLPHEHTSRRPPPVKQAPPLET